MPRNGVLAEQKIFGPRLLFFHATTSCTDITTLPTMSPSSTLLSPREKMAQYAPTPHLDKMNPIQRYLHKGALEPWDWARLALIVIAYLLLRPSIEWLVRKYFDADPFKTSQDARQAAKAKAKVSPNVIRGAVSETEQENPLSLSHVTASGREPTANDVVSGRRGKGKS